MSNPMRRGSYGFIAWIFIVSMAWAVDPVALVQKKLSAIHTMSSAFSQKVVSKHRVISRTSGTMALARPGRFRWQTTHPMAQTVVADGKKLWIYDVELEQVTVSRQTTKLGAASALFLSQSEDAVAQDFEVQYHQKGGLDLFDLHAKSAKANFDKVRLIFQGEILQGIELYDQLGQRTVVSFSKVLMNKPIAEQLFQFTIPVGVDVVRQ